MCVQLYGLGFFLEGKLDSQSAKIIFAGYFLDCVVVFHYSKKHSLK